MTEFTQSQYARIAAAGAASRQNAVRRGVVDPQALDWERHKGEGDYRALIVMQRSLKLS